MDPLSALGIAAAAVGFFDFAVTLVNEYRGIRDRGGSTTLASMSRAAKDLIEARKSFLQRVPNSPDPNQPRTISDHEEAVDQLLTECDEIANRLLQGTNFLTREDSNKSSRWANFKQEVLIKWKVNDFKDMHEQLNTLRGQLALRLLAVINAKLDYSSEQQTKGLGRLDKRAAEIVDILALQHQSLSRQIDRQRREITSASKGIMEAIVTLRDGSTRSVMLSGGEGSTVLPGGLYDGFAMRQTISIGGTKDGSSAMMGVGNLDDITYRVLDCLHFRQMRDRVESIPEAHAQTFQWIFHEPKEDMRWDNFPKWLEEGDRCYWINGKAGSGKSTLMKLICSDDRRLEHLSHWAGGKPLLTASFFFWYLGTPLQKSETGLLRSLLHDILAQEPALIPTVMPELCQEIAKKQGGYYHVADPSIAELTRWFKNLACNLPVHQQAKFCFFIDGLDEFVGDHPDLKDFFIKTASLSTSVKFVLSSRPLTTFTDSFQHFPNLRLQDITEGDIRTYINSLLGDKLSTKLGDEWAAFLEEMVTKSSGVFIWVSLVVKSLLSGLRDGDNVPELRARLDELPSDLKDLYQHMLDRIPHRYRHDASEIFQIVVTNVLGKDGNGLITQLRLFELSCALRKPSDFPFGKSAQLISKEVRKIKAKETEERIRARCLGLIEVHTGSSSHDELCNAPVDFLHRTVLEFLSIERIEDTLGSTPGFDPLVSLFQACLWMGRSAPIVKRPTHEQDREAWKYLGDAFLIAAQAESMGSPMQVKWIEELDRIYTERWDKTTTLSISVLEPIPKPCYWTWWLFVNSGGNLTCGTTNLITFENLYKSKGNPRLGLGNPRVGEVFRDKERVH